MAATITSLSTRRQRPGIASLLAALTVPAQAGTGSTITIPASLYETLTADTLNIAMACYDQGRHDERMVQSP